MNPNIKHVQIKTANIEAHCEYSVNETMNDVNKPIGIADLAHIWRLTMTTKLSIFSNFYRQHIAQMRQTHGFGEIFLAFSLSETGRVF